MLWSLCCIEVSLCCSEIWYNFVSLESRVLLLSALLSCVYMEVYFSLSQNKKSIYKRYLQHISASHCLADMSSFLLDYCCCCSLFSVRPHKCSARSRHTKNSPYPNHSLDSLTAVKYNFFFSYLIATAYAALQGRQKLSVDNLSAWLLLRWLSAAELCPKNYCGI